MRTLCASRFLAPIIGSFEGRHIVISGFEKYLQCIIWPLSRRCLLYRKEIDKVIERVNVFEALDRASLDGQQNRLASCSRIESERLRRNDAAFNRDRFHNVGRLNHFNP
jgi:hypothetical protein